MSQLLGGNSEHQDHQTIYRVSGAAYVSCYAFPSSRGRLGGWGSPALAAVAFVAFTVALARRFPEAKQPRPLSRSHRPVWPRRKLQHGLNHHSCSIGGRSSRRKNPGAADRSLVPNSALCDEVRPFYTCLAAEDTCDAMAMLGPVTHFLSSHTECFANPQSSGPC